MRHFGRPLKFYHLKTTPTQHLPAKIIAAPALPVTQSGQTLELVAKNLIHGLPIRNLSVIANPDVLSYFKDLTELQISKEDPYGYRIADTAG